MSIVLIPSKVLVDPGTKFGGRRKLGYWLSSSVKVLLRLGPFTLVKPAYGGAVLRIGNVVATLDGWPYHRIVFGTMIPPVLIEYKRGRVNNWNENLTSRENVLNIFADSQVWGRIKERVEGVPEKALFWVQYSKILLFFDLHGKSLTPEFPKARLYVSETKQKDSP